MERINRRREDGMFGVDSIILIAAFLFSLIIVFTVNSKITSLSWKGFITMMQPDYLYPAFRGVFTSRPGDNVIIAAIYLQQNVVMRYFVNSLFLIILLFMGISYIYSDMFEQYFGKLKTLLPRVVFGLLLAYSSLYIVEALMIIGKSAYTVFYMQPAFSAWKHEDYIFHVCPDIKIVAPNSSISSLNQLVNIYWHHSWVFIVMVETISLLIFVAFRMVLLALLIVILPIASILLIHPWTQSIGARLWWLAVSLIFLPVVMIIPLMLSTVVGNSVSFFIATLALVLGSAYLLVKEPSMLSGVGFQKAGTMLTGGVVGGGMSGAINIKEVKLGNIEKLSPTLSYKKTNMLVGKMSVYSVVNVNKSAGSGNLGNSMGKWVENKGGLRR